MKPPTTDPDELELEEIEAARDPLRMPNTVDRIEWRMMYGEYASPTALHVYGCAVLALLGLILWRLW